MKVVKSPRTEKMAVPLKLKVSLENMPHKIYRKLLVPTDINMMQLHFIIQVAMGWENVHMFEFRDKRYDNTIAVSIPDPDYDNNWAILPGFNRRPPKTEPETVGLAEEFYIKRDKKPFLYWYDFGDDWWHKITFQKPTKKELEIFSGIPLCMDAEGKCPPEDIGGPWGYAAFLEAVKDKKHPEHYDIKAWLGLGKNQRYDESFTNLEQINRMLARLPLSVEWSLNSKDYYED